MLSVNKISINKISFICISNYKVYNAKNDEIIEKITNRKILINMEFTGLKWIVTSVSIK